jgi:uncharacterized protein DUF4339
MGNWFYIHQGRTLGPADADELRRLAQTGGLEPGDPVWRQDADPAGAVPAGSVLVFFLAGGKATPPPRAFPPSVPAPAWLANLIDAPKAVPVRAGPAPDWLPDVRRAEETARSHARSSRRPAAQEALSS